jgi:hypothetical protein
VLEDLDRPVGQPRLGEHTGAVQCEDYRDCKLRGLPPEHLRLVPFEQAKVDVRRTQRVKRVFVIDREACTGCGGKR